MNEEQAERPRPRVVDKRVSAGGGGTGAADAPPERQGAPESAPVASEEPSGAQPPSAAPREPQEPPASSADAPGGESAAGPGGVWTPEQEAEARRFAEEVAATPSIEWVVNSAVTLANVAATKLDLGDPADASLAIDALAGVIKEVGPRLGNVETPLRQTLAQLQMAFAERTAPPGGGAGGPLTT